MQENNGSIILHETPEFYPDTKYKINYNLITLVSTPTIFEEVAKCSVKNDEILRAPDYPRRQCGISRVIMDQRNNYKDPTLVRALSRLEISQQMRPGTVMHTT